MDCSSGYWNWSWLQTDQLGDEPIYCESYHNHDDVLCEGSDDEHYPDPTTRRLRYEEQGLKFLDGRIPFLLSASLQGPFTRESGWKNPWRGRGTYRRKKPVQPAQPVELPAQAPLQDGDMLDQELQPSQQQAELPKPAREGHISSSCHLPSPQSSIRSVVEENPYMDEEALVRVQTWRADVSLSSAAIDSFWASKRQEEPVHGPKRTAPADWLRRKDMKRSRFDGGVVTSTHESPSAALVHRSQAVDTANAAMPSTSEDQALDVEQPAIGCDSSNRAATSSASPYTEKLQSGGECVRDSTQSPEEAPAATLPTASADDEDAEMTGSQQPLGSESTKAQQDEKESNPETRQQRARKSKKRATEKQGVVSTEPEPRKTSVAATKDDNFASQQDESFCFRARTMETRSKRREKANDPSEEASLMEGPTLVSSQPREKGTNRQSQKSTARSDESMAPGESAKDMIDFQKGSGSEIGGPVAVPRQSETTEIASGGAVLPKGSISDQEPIIDTIQVTKDETENESEQSTPTTVSSVEDESVPDNGLASRPEFTYPVETDSGQTDDEPKSSPPNTPEKARSPRLATQQQSPWVAEADLLLQSSIGGDQETENDSQIHESQSPWTADDNAMLLSSSAKLTSPISPNDKAFSAGRQPVLHHQTAKIFDGIQPDIAHSSQRHSTPTPDTKQSSLATPEVTLSIKSFANLMTPSPEKKVARRSNGLSSVLSNPWAKTSSRQSGRRVRFAPLPGEEEGTSAHASDDEGEYGEGRAGPRRDTRKAEEGRASSPPPSLLLADLPDKTEKFSKHFATVARKNRFQMRRAPLKQRLLPNASQQVLQSPPVGAMAEAFLEADERVGAQDNGNERSPSSGLEEEKIQDENAEQHLDDVSAVLHNLSDFLDSWDVDADLAKARTETGQEQKTAATVTGMDVGVWN